jgi:hypothetical protein
MSTVSCIGLQYRDVPTLPFDVAFTLLYLGLSKSLLGRVASWTSCSLFTQNHPPIQGATMAEPSTTAISSSPCHLGGITRLAFAPDGQYVPCHVLLHLVLFIELDRKMDTND